MYFAKKFGITPIGTMAHEFLQAFQALDVRLRNFQKAALEAWVQEYRGDLGIALTDVVGMDAFLRDFDFELASRYQGLRHDSGDPVVWGEKAISHYQRLGIDPAEKMLVFSDGLNLDKAVELLRIKGHSKIKCAVKWAKKGKSAVEIASMYGILRITPITPEVIRISFVKGVTAKVQDTYWKPKADTAFPWSAKESKTAVLVETEKLRVMVEKRTARCSS